MDALRHVARHKGFGDGGAKVVRLVDEDGSRGIGAALGEQIGPALKRQHRGVVPRHERVEITFAAEALEKECCHGPPPKWQIIPVRLPIDFCDFRNAIATAEESIGSIPGYL